MVEKLHFKIINPVNIVRMCATILFEKDDELFKNYGYIWNKILNTSEGEKYFERFMEEVMPDGGLIGETELKEILKKAIRFLQSDERARTMQSAYARRRYGSYVYFRPENKIYPCDFGSHMSMVQNILVDYFKGSCEYEPEEFKAFLLGNFEIKSNNTRIESVVNDYEYLARCVLMKTKSYM